MAHTAGPKLVSATVTLRPVRSNASRPLMGSLNVSGRTRPAGPSSCTTTWADEPVRDVVLVTAASFCATGLAGSAACAEAGASKANAASIHALATVAVSREAAAKRRLPWLLVRSVFMFIFLHPCVAVQQKTSPHRRRGLLDRLLCKHPSPRGLSVLAQAVDLTPKLLSLDTVARQCRTLTGFAVATHAIRGHECLCSHVLT